MSALAVAKKDFKRTARSRALWAAATLLALITVLLVYGYQGYQLTPTEEWLQAFRTLGLLLAVVLPIVALVASYLAIAGERESGGIKFLLAFPNTRRDVVVGKLANRLLVVGAGVTFPFVAAAAVGVARHGVLPVGTFLGLFALSLVYGFVFVGLAVALSASVAARSRAIGASVGSYLLLVVLYVVPIVRIPDLVRWLHSTMLGMDPNPDLYSAVTYTSPFVAYRKATNLVFPEDMRRQVFRRSAEAAGDLPAYLTDEFSLVVLAVWLVVPIVLGTLRFEGSDLD